MSDLRPKPVPFELEGKEYGLLFTLNVIDDFQDKFDTPISQLSQLLVDERKVFKVLKELLSMLINEAIDNADGDEKHVDAQFVGRKILVSDIPRLKTKILAAFIAGIPVGDEDEGPNANCG